MKDHDLGQVEWSPLRRVVDLPVRFERHHVDEPRLETRAIEHVPQAVVFGREEGGARARHGHDAEVCGAQEECCEEMLHGKRRAIFVIGGNENGNLRRWALAGRAKAERMDHVPVLDDVQKDENFEEVGVVLLVRVSVRRRKTDESLDLEGILG